MRRRHAVGDVARVIRESLRDVRGRVALGTVTAPGGTFNSAEASAWNLGAGKQWRLLRDRIKREMSRKYGLRPPVVLVRVAQRQGTRSPAHRLVVCQRGARGTHPALGGALPRAQ